MRDNNTGDTNPFDERPEATVAPPRIVLEVHCPGAARGVERLGVHVGQVVAAQVQRAKAGDVLERVRLDVRYPALVEADVLEQLHVAEQTGLQRVHRVPAEHDDPQPRRVMERARAKHADLVVGQVQVMERGQTAERVPVHRSDGTAVQDQFLQVDQTRPAERVPVQPGQVVSGQVQHLHVAAHVLGHRRETRPRTVGRLPFGGHAAPTRARAARRCPVLGRGRRRT